MEPLVSITTSEFKLGMIDNPHDPWAMMDLSCRAASMGLLDYICPGTV